MISLLFITPQYPHGAEFSAAGAAVNCSWQLVDIEQQLLSGRVDAVVVDSTFAEQEQICALAESSRAVVFHYNRWQSQIMYQGECLVHTNGTISNWTNQT